MTDDWLNEKTGHDSAWWIAYIQKAIDRASRPTRDKHHDTTDIARWLRDVCAQAMRSRPRKAGKYDGNMRAAAIVAQVLAAWFLRVQRAKAFDPRRPVKLRREAYESWLAYSQGLTSLVYDERHDHEHFPGQRWENPFLPDAIDGYFV